MLNFLSTTMSNIKCFAYDVDKYKFVSTIIKADFIQMLKAPWCLVSKVLEVYFLFGLTESLKYKDMLWLQSL